MNGGLLPTRCMDADCEHEWVYWAQSHPDDGLRVIDALMSSESAARSSTQATR